MSPENKNDFPDVDHSEIFKSIVGNGPFDDFFTFDESFSKFQKQTGTVFNKCAGSSVYYENKRRKKPVPEKFQYVSIQFQCVHFGEPKPKSTGQRPNQTYLPCGCKAAFRLVYRKKALYITSQHLVHQNHLVDLERAKLYSKNRRLNEKQEKDVTKLMETEDQFVVQQFLQDKYDKHLTTKDIANIKQKRKQNLSMTQRWEKADEITKRINKVLRDAQTPQFSSRVSQFEELLKSMEQEKVTPVPGTPPCVLSVSSVSDSFGSDTKMSLEASDVLEDDDNNIITIHRVGGGIIL